MFAYSNMPEVDQLTRPISQACISHFDMSGHSEADIIKKK